MNEPRYLPTEAEIEIETEKFRSTWDDFEFEVRSRTLTSVKDGSRKAVEKELEMGYTIPEYSVDDIESSGMDRNEFVNILERNWWPTTNGGDR